MLNTLKKLVDPIPPAQAATVMNLETSLVAAKARAEETRNALDTALEGYDPAVLAQARQAHADALLAVDDAAAKQRAAVKRQADATAVVAREKKIEHDTRVRETAEACLVTAKALHDAAVKYAKKHKAYMAARIANGDALSPSGTAQRQRSMLSMDSVLGRCKLDLLTLGVIGACRIPIDVNKVRPFLEVVEEEQIYFTSQACADAGDKA